MFKRIINWFKLSNRWKHLLLGYAIGAVSDDNYCASLAGVCAAGCMEVKDKMWGGQFDWIDFGITLAGVVVGRLTHVLLWGT